MQEVSGSIPLGSTNPTSQLIEFTDNRASAMMLILVQCPSEVLDED